MPDLSLSEPELEDLRVALMSAHHAARDEERALRFQLDMGDFEDDAHREAFDLGRVQAAHRAFRYHILAERVMAAKGGI